MFYVFHFEQKHNKKHIRIAYKGMEMGGMHVICRKTIQQEKENHIDEIRNLKAYSKKLLIEAMSRVCSGHR
jgi:hypothetical protein